MKVAFIGQKGIPGEGGGVEKHVEEISARLVLAGHKALVYTRPNYTDKNLTMHRGVELISLPTIPAKNFDAISHTILACLDLIFMKRKVDLIHFHSIGPSSLIWLVKLFMPKTPVISTFHSQCYFHKKWGIFARLYLKFGELASCRFADRTIVISDSLKKLAKDKYGINAKYIPNGAEIKKSLPAREIKKKWGLEKGGYLLAVSRLLPVKGIHYLIEAYKKIDTDKRLVIAGEGSFTEKYVNKLKALAGSSPNIIFTGNLSGDLLNEIYSNAYVFVQPSEIEGLSLALLEAMAYGTPVLASDIPENKEAIGEAGLFFKSSDSADLKEKLVFSLANPDWMIKRAVEAKTRVKKNYSWDFAAKETERVYKEAMGRKSEAFYFSRILRWAFRNEK